MSCGPLSLLTDRCLEIPRGYNLDKVKLALGSDGFPAEFYQFFWEVVKPDLMNLFYEFHARRLSIHSQNFGVITLLPNIADAARIQQYRPICLLNVSFKIFTNVLNNRI
jgi:hypothetical protein